MKICNPNGTNPVGYCQHTLDRIGLPYNMSNAAQNGTFEVCDSGLMDIPGVYTSGGQTLSYSQPAETVSIGLLPMRAASTANPTKAFGSNENEARPNLSGLRPPMASSGLIEASEKEQFIEIWLTHLKSSAKSSHSSLHSHTSSISSAATSSAKAIGQGIKRIKKGTGAIVRPLKRAKHALSNVSSPVISDAEDPTTDDQASIKTNGLLEVIAVGSDEELDDLEKELAVKETWRSPIYSFFKPKVTIEVHHGRVAHFFTCSSKKCKTEARGVQRYQDKGDKSSTANLRHHAVRCFGEDTVNESVGGVSGSQRSGNIFSAFASQGQKPVVYSHRAHSGPEFRAHIAKWVAESNRPATIVSDPELVNLLTTGHPHLGSDTGISRYSINSLSNSPNFNSEIIANWILDEDVLIRRHVETGQPANPYALSPSISTSSAFAAISSRPHAPHPVCANCKKETHSADYCIAPRGKLAGRTIEEARAAYRAAQGKTQTSCDSQNNCQPRTHNQTALVTTSNTLTASRSSVMSSLGPVFVNGLPYVLDPNWSSTSTVTSSAHIAEVDDSAETVVYPYHAFLAYPNLSSPPLFPSTFSVSFLPSPLLKSSLPFVIDMGTSCHISPILSDFKFIHAIKAHPIKGLGDHSVDAIGVMQQWGGTNGWGDLQPWGPSQSWGPEWQRTWGATGEFR
ncbi:hypothetical protein F5888DRAFT_1871875 [Russula emetica]|nr:hypothetical protein F5888DRAFT_1871875 [Russula emetica]